MVLFLFSVLSVLALHWQSSLTLCDRATAYLTLCHSSPSLLFSHKGHFLGSWNALSSFLSQNLCTDSSLCLNCSSHCLLFYIFWILTQTSPSKRGVKPCFLFTPSFLELITTGYFRVCLAAPTPSRTRTKVSFSPLPLQDFAQ